MNYSTPGLPVHHQHQEFTQTHIHRVGDAIQPSHPLLSAIQPSHPLSSPSPTAPNPSQHQSFPMSNVRHPSNITCCWTHALTLDTSSDSTCGLAHALTLDTLQDSWPLGITGCWAHALALDTLQESLPLGLTGGLAHALTLDTLQDSWPLGITGCWAHALTLDTLKDHSWAVGHHQRLGITSGWAHALELDTLQGWIAFKESFQGGTHFSRREEPGSRKQRALECKKNAFPGGQALQRGLMGLNIKANRLRKEKCTCFVFFNLFHIILFIP